MPHDRDQEQGQSPSLHRQVVAGIREQIAQCGLSAHAKLASEVALAKQFGVSRGTVTKALDTLVRQGVLYRRRPQGTFIAETLPATGADSAVLATDAARPVVGLVIPFLPDGFVGSIILGVETVTRAAGYGLIFAHSENDWALERYHLEQLCRSRAAGILIFPADFAVEHRAGHLVSLGNTERIAALRGLQQTGMPMVLIDRYVPEIECDFVVSDDTTAGYAATQHLIALGHRRLGFISITPQVSSTVGRYAGFRHCLEQYDLPLDERSVLHALRQSSPSSMPGGSPLPGSGSHDRALLLDYLQRPERPTALVVANDYIALRVLQVAENLGLDVPDDLAIVCCGGGDIGAHARVPLTSIAQPASDLGRQAAHVLLDRIAGRSSVVRRLTLPVSLVVRRSCGAGARPVPLAIAPLTVPP